MSTAALGVHAATPSAMRRSSQLPSADLVLASAETRYAAPGFASIFSTNGSSPTCSSQIRSHTSRQGPNALQVAEHRGNANVQTASAAEAKHVSLLVSDDGV